MERARLAGFWLNPEHPPLVKLVFHGSYRLPWLKIFRRLVLADRALGSDPPDRRRAAQ